MESQPLVSIIIVNLNRKKELTKCIESINFQNYKNFEILLIDNNSDDGSIESIKSKFTNTLIYKTSKNLGTSYTRNAGVNFSNGELIWFLDSDTYLSDENVLLNLVNKFLINSEIDAIGGEAIINEKNQVLGTKKLVLYPNGMTKGYLDNSDIKNKVEVLATCNLMIRKKTIEDVGGFDHFYFFYLEDLDLTYRVFKEGYKMQLIEKCPVIHYFSEKSRFKNHFQAKKNRIYFIIKNFSILNILFLPIYDLVYLLNFDNLNRIYKKLFQDKKLENKNFKIMPKKFSITNVVYTIKISLITVISMLFSYIYIPYYLIKYFSHRKIKINFLDLINNEDFIIINKRTDIK